MLQSPTKDKPENLKDNISIFTGASNTNTKDQDSVEYGQGVVFSKSVRNLKQMRKKNVNYHKDLWKLNQPSMSVGHSSFASNIKKTTAMKGARK